MKTLLTILAIILVAGCGTEYTPAPRIEVSYHFYGEQGSVYEINYIGNDGENNHIIAGPVFIDTVYAPLAKGNYVEFKAGDKNGGCHCRLKFFMDSKLHTSYETVSDNRKMEFIVELVN